MSTASLRREIDELCHERGFAAARVARAAVDGATRDVLRRRIRRGDLSLLPWFDERRAEVATDPDHLLHGARSVIMLASRYASRWPARPAGLRGRVARYAWGRDYHRVLPRRAKPILELLAARVPESRSRFLVDSYPFAERAYARAAGLGWQGKNTMLLARGLGSYTVISSILTTVELDADAPGAEGCGACTRCLPSCPTGALREEYRVISDHCIAYWTIEHRGPIPPAMRPAIGEWLFGCDLCQEACPVNHDTDAGIDELRAAEAEAAHPDLVTLLDLDEIGFRARFRGRALARANYAGLLRNACIVLGNLGDERAVPALVRAVEHAEPLVRGHAAWALGRLEAGGPLARRHRRETDAWVRSEIEAALDHTRGLGPSPADPLPGERHVEPAA